MKIQNTKGLYTRHVLFAQIVERIEKTFKIILSIQSVCTYRLRAVFTHQNKGNVCHFGLHFFKKFSSSAHFEELGVSRKVTLYLFNVRMMIVIYRIGTNTVKNIEKSNFCLQILLIISHCRLFYKVWPRIKRSRSSSCLVYV